MTESTAMQSAGRAAGNGPDPLLSVRGLTHRFGDVVALDDVDVDIHDNEFFALLGPSGCGKTTLLRAIAGFEQPDRGQLLLDGQDLAALPAHRRPVNLMFQSYALFPHLSVRRNIAYGLEAERVSRAEVRSRVDEVLDTVGLGPLQHRKPQHLSGGQRQRVALARAIVKRPRLLLLDEPLSALDRKVRAEMQLELKRLQHEVGMTFVVVTHDQDEAMSMADRILVMNSGRAEQLDTPVRLYQQPATRFVADFVGTSNMFDGSLTAGGVQVPGLGLLPARAGSLTPGSAVTLVVRPEDIRLTAAGDGGLRGTVIDSFFTGGSSTLSVALPGHERPVMVTVHAAADRRRGEPVGLRWEADRAVVVPRRGGQGQDGSP